MSSRLRHLAAGAIAATVVAAAVHTASAAPVEVERLQATRAALEATTAHLALARTRERALAGPELRANLRLQATLERRKARLLAAERTRLPAAERALVHARARAADARAARQSAASTTTAAVPAAAGTPGDLPGSDAQLARTIDAYLASKSSPLTGEGAAFVRASRAVGLDPRLLVAIAGAETSFGTYGPSQAIHNPFGMGPGIVYPTWADAIEGAARNLGGDLYLGDGRITIAAIHARWAPIGAGNDPGGLNGNWAGNVGHYYAEQGGDPTVPVFGAAAPAAAQAPRPRARRPERDAPRPRAAALETRIFAEPASGPMLDAVRN